MRIKHDKGILIGDSDERYIFGNETKVKQVESDEHNKLAQSTRLRKYKKHVMTMKVSFKVFL